MDSLYGGKPGVSFVIKASFSSIGAMVAAFKKGANYTTVWYGEYVLIDTVNKNHKDNGKIYRRGLDYQNTLGGAEYIGQIVGPSSGTPYFQVDDLSSVLESAKIPANGEDVWKKYPTGKDSNGKYIISENGPGTDITTFSFTQNNGLVPGRTDSGTYNDGIKFTWVNIRMDNADADSWFYVGFEIPYLVINYNVKTNSPYDSLGNRTDKSTIERTDNKQHPFYEEFLLGIPRGIKGDSLENLKIIVPTATDKIYTPDQIKISLDKTTGNFTTTLGTAGYDGLQNDIANKYQILVYEYVYYDKLAAGEKVLIYLGDYKMINSITLNDDGTLNIQMTHDGTTSFVKKIVWIVGAKITSDYRFILTTNTGAQIEVKNEDGTTFHLRLLEDVKLLAGINDDKHIQVKYSDESTYRKIGEPINYIKDMVVRTDDWHLLVLYSEPTKRATAAGLDSNSRDKNGNLWVSGITGSDGTVYGTSVYWQDMGTIKDQSGVLIGFNVTSEEVKASPYDSILEYLDNNYRYGLTGADNSPNGLSLEGKIVTYKQTGVEDAEFYAYDYNLGRWYYLGAFRDNGNSDARLLNWTTTSGAAKNEVINNLNTHGLLVTSYNVEIPSDGLEDKHFWEWNYKWV